MPGVMHEVHVLKPLERHGQNQPFHIFIRVPAFGENAGTLLRGFALFYPMLIEGCEFLNNILDAGLPTLIHVIQKRQNKDGFVGIAHGHRSHHVHEHLLHVGGRD